MKKTIRIPLMTPSLNEIKKMMYKQHYRYKELIETWGEYFTIHKVYLGLAKGPRRVTVISARKKICDDDNFRGGLKPVFDAMVNTRLLINDDPKHLTPGPHIQIPCNTQDTTIIFEDLY